MSEDEGARQLFARLSKIDGALMATQAAVRALILLAPDAVGAAATVARAIDELHAVAVNSLNEEAFVDAIREAKKNVLPVDAL